MDALLTKLNYKEGMKIFMAELPSEFISTAMAWTNLGIVVEKPAGADFFLSFATTTEGIARNFLQIKDNIQEDQVFWMAYPKGSSKKYKASINRDSGWEILGQNGFEGVRQVAIDADWSALRFRKVDFIKNLTRKNRLTS
jgi:hypothetical protein